MMGCIGLGRGQAQHNPSAASAVNAVFRVICAVGARRAGGPRPTSVATAADIIYGWACRPAAVSAYAGLPVSTLVDASSRTEPVSSMATALAAARAARDAR